MKKTLENIFSVKNNYIHKVITIFGIKLKFKSKKLLKRYKKSNIGIHTEKVNLYLHQENIDTYNKNIYEHKYLNDEKITVDFIDNGIVLPFKHHYENDIEFFDGGGVIRPDFSFVENSAMIKIRDYSTENMITNGYKPEKVVQSNETVMYAGLLFAHWGHFLIEQTTRLWWYVQNKEKYPNLKLVFLKRFDGYCDYNKQELEFLSFLGIKREDYEIIETPTQFKQVIVPEYSAILGREYKKEYLIPFDEISKQIKPDKFKKVYFSRTKMTWNKNTIGEAEFEKIFKKLGFKIVYPEQLTLKKQIALIKGAEYFVALNGSACHNLLFANSDIKPIIINRFSRINNAQFLVDNAKKYKPTYIDSCIDILPVTHGGGPFWLVPNENLVACLKDFGFDTTNIDTNIKAYARINTQSYLQKYIEAFDPTNKILKPFCKRINELTISSNKED